MLGTVAVLTAAGWLLGADLRVALIGAMALSLSSTALALQPLAERGALGTQGGQTAFAVLLFQDLAVIPMLAMLPLLALAPVAHTLEAHGARPWTRRARHASAFDSEDL